MTYDVDVVVVGAGAGGGVAASVLAESGKSVFLVERGRKRNYADSGHRDHLRNHRLQRYGINTGPDLEGNPRVCLDPEGTAQVVRAHDESYHGNAAAVGGGTLVYGGLAWRFHPDDFRMASRYGVPPGSSLTDWPIAYTDLEPWYSRAEWEIGVAGQAGANPHEGPRTRAYPMPPVPVARSTAILRAGAEILGLATFAPPLLINTVRRDGRAVCIRCGSCVGFPCPSDAKNGTQNTVIPRALRSGLCALMTGTTVERIAVDNLGHVIGVDLVSAAPSGEQMRRQIRARAVVLAAGAIETARLLLLSASAREPYGLGNSHDLVGRNLQGHVYPTSFGLFEEPIQDSSGPGVSIATCDYNHGNPGVIGGAMLADDFVMLPIIFWKWALPEDVPRFGIDAKRFMRDNFRRVVQVKGPVQEIPVPDSRVTLDRHVRDRYGCAVVRLSGAVHPETLRTAAFIRAKAAPWLQASGATKTWSPAIPGGLSAGQHQAGTCRMGEDPRVSVTDPFGRVWGHENLFVMDASVHPTNGGYNPVLTIMALAYRNATALASRV